MVANRISILLPGVVLSMVMGSAPALGVPHSHEPIRLSDYRFEFAVLPDSVIPYQMIWLKVAVTNISSRTVPKPNLVSGDGLYSISYVDDKGRPMPIPVWEGNGPGAVSVGNLESGQPDVHFVALSSEVWNPLRPPDSSRVGRTIRVVVTLDPNAFVDEPGRDSALIPRYLPFRTMWAQGDEIGATAMYLRAFFAPMKVGDPSPEPLWRELIERHPDSRLVEAALRELHFLAKEGVISGKTPLEAVLSVVRETIQRRPESPLLTGMILRLGRGPGFTTADYDSLMHEIAARRPDSPALEALKARRQNEAH
jgi:hypothetical protein